ncbi:MAG: hypothetical protein E7241_05220 [Lachnospiraceae bacterium]|jgi:3D (Asp-Asp-Asp) domain-containing protein|nr:hypothetical protein [Lachnospiraceae bacterium]
MKKALFYIVPFILIVLFCVSLAGGEVRALEGQPGPAEQTQPELVPVEVTAYYDYMHHLGIGRDGRPLVEGLTIAGPEAWLGYTIALYDLDYTLIGLYEVRDIGYGKSLGWKYGASKLRRGSPIGDIEAGKTLDLYFESKQDCLNWGRRKCYMQLIRSEG